MKPLFDWRLIAVGVGLLVAAAVVKTLAVYVPVWMLAW